jgi:hypothetical protein
MYTAEADRTKIARAQIFSIASQNMDNEIRWTERRGEKKVKVKQSHYRPGQALRVPGG